MIKTYCIYRIRYPITTHKAALYGFYMPNRYQKYYNKIKTMSIDLLSYSSLRTAL